MKKLLLILFSLPLFLHGQDYQKGYNYYINGKYELSVDYFTKAISKDSNNPSLYTVRGLSYKSINSHELAINDYTKSIELFPYQMFEKDFEDFDWSELVNNYKNRAFSYLQLKQYKLSILDYRFILENTQELKKLLEINPTILIDIHINIGVCKMNLGLNYCKNFQIACLLGDEEGCKLYNTIEMCKEEQKDRGDENDDVFSIAFMREYEFRDSIQAANFVPNDTILWDTSDIGWSDSHFTMKGFYKTSTHKFTKKELLWHVKYYGLNYKIIRN